MIHMTLVLLHVSSGSSHGNWQVTDLFLVNCSVFYDPFLIFVGLAPSDPGGSPD